MHAIRTSLFVGDLFIGRQAKVLTPSINEIRKIAVNKIAIASSDRRSERIGGVAQHAAEHAIVHRG